MPGIVDVALDMMDDEVSVVQCSPREIAALQREYNRMMSDTVQKIGRGKLKLKGKNDRG